MTGFAGQMVQGAPSGAPLVSGRPSSWPMSRSQTSQVRTSHSSAGRSFPVLRHPMVCASEERLVASSGSSNRLPLPLRGALEPAMSQSSQRPCVGAARANHSSIRHHDLISPPCRLEIRRRTPDAESLPPGVSGANMRELYLRLAPRFVQGRTDTVMPFANDSRRGLHDVEDVDRRGRPIISGR